MVRVDGGSQSDSPPLEVWGRGGGRGGVRAEDGERRVGTWIVVQKESRGSTQESKTDSDSYLNWPQRKRLDLDGPPSTFGPQSDSSSLHTESNSIYQCAWTRPLRQYQPLSVPMSLQLRIHNRRYASASRINWIFQYLMLTYDIILTNCQFSILCPFLRFPFPL